MRFYQTLLAGAALVAGVLAQKPTIDNISEPIVAGKTVEVTYSPKTATAKFLLRKGDSDDLKTISTLTESATGGTFMWNVDPALEDDDDYALQIVVGSEDNYRGPFAITGGTGQASSSSASASGSASTSMSGSSSMSMSASSSMSMTSSASSVSGSASASASMNSTITLPSLSTGSTTLRPSATGGSETTTGGIPENTGAASTLSSSPLALIFGAVAAFAYLN